MGQSVSPLTFHGWPVKNAEPSPATFIFRNAARSVDSRPPETEEPMQHDAPMRAEPMEANLVTDITLARDLARLRIVVPGGQCDCARLVEMLEAQGIRVNGVDLASAAGSGPSTEITLMLRHADVARARLLVYECLDSVDEYDVQCESELATISIVGFGVSFDLAMVARIMSSLGQQQIGVHELATSEDRIDCFVDPEGAERAVAALHEELGRQERVA